ncbi:MAG: hypothetical protein LH478_05335 [Chitinophagaceae bacterium]|nr:hypothetical protein [Chitinophagaceae bacterium]
MIYPNLSLAKSDFIDYYKNADFDRLIFQFRLSEFYGSEIATMVCYAMNNTNQPMHPFPIMLKNLTAYKSFGLPANYGNLVMDHNFLPTLVGRAEHIMNFNSLIFIPYLETLDYIGYDVYPSLSEPNLFEEKDKALTASGRINPCPPVACSVITPA